MNKGEFMRELEYLLQDISDEDKKDAIAYYEDYLEEAGEENEEAVILEFGSPERVAAIIRADLKGNLDEGGEFTESGYQDERFRDPRYQVVQRKDLPEMPEEDGWKRFEENEQNGESQEEKDRQSNLKRGGILSKGSTGSFIVKVILVFVLFCVVSPVVLGVGGGMAGIAVGAVALFLGVVLLVGVLTVTAWIGAVALFVMGIFMLISNLWSGVMVIGFGVLAFGLALLGTAISLLLYGKLLPFCFCSIINGLNSLFHRERRHKA